MFVGLGMITAGGSVKPAVAMLARENNVSLILISEVLASLLYPHYSYEVYREFPPYYYLKSQNLHKRKGEE